MKLNILIPAYNEESNIIPLLESIEDYSKINSSLKISIIVCDDGSTDKTNLLLKAYKAKTNLIIIQNENNLGLTKTLNKLIMTISSEQESEFVAIMDGDGSHLPSDLGRMMELIKDCDVVIASRFHSDSSVNGVSIDRKLYSLILSFLYRIAFRIKNVRDYSCGYRLYRSRIIFNLRKQFGDNILTMNSFASSMELLLKCDRVGAIFKEAPITLRYDFKKSKSKMPVIKTILDSFKLIYLLKRDQL